MFLVFVVAIAAMIMRVSRSQNRVMSACMACFVISSSIFCFGLLLSVCALCCLIEVFSR